MGTLKDVNTTSIEEAIRLGCHTMQNVFDADDNHIPFFRSVVYPASEAHLGFSAHHSESHVPGRHLNALLNAADLIDVDITEAAIEKHRRAAFLSFSGPVALALNRTEVGGPLVNFCPHNLREGLHALYALTAFRDDGEARELAERCIADVLDLWSARTGWDEGRLQSLGLVYQECQGFVHGEARMLGPLVKYFRATGHGPALELAMLFAEKAVNESYLEDGDYNTGRFVTQHSHSITCTLSSLAQLADLLGDACLLRRVRAFFDNGLWKMRDKLGWSPERALMENCDDGEMNNTGDILETALILGRHGFPDYHADAERILRCHVLPAQLRDVSFIEDPPNPEGVDGLKNLADRHRGAFGFPAPYGHQALGDGRHKMAFNMDVVGGTVGSLCEALREAIRSDASGHHVNLLFDRDSGDVAVRSPYTHDGLEIEVRDGRPLFVRIPSWVSEEELNVEPAAAEPRRLGNHLLFPQPGTGAIRIRFRLAEREETLPGTVHVNPIRVRLRGDAVVAMDSFGADYTFFDDY